MSRFFSSFPFFFFFFFQPKCQCDIFHRAVKLDPDLGDSWACFYRFELQHGTEVCFILILAVNYVNVELIKSMLFIRLCFFNIGDTSLVKFQLHYIFICSLVCSYYFSIICVISVCHWYQLVLVNRQKTGHNGYTVDKPL